MLFKRKCLAFILEKQSACDIGFIDVGKQTLFILFVKSIVLGVDDTGSVMVKWDNGCGLNVVYGEDLCRRIEE